MKKFDHFCANVLVFIVAMVLLNSSMAMAQRASAEFISSILPTHLETGQEIKDGIQNVSYSDNVLYVVNVWAGIQVVDVSDKANPKEIGKYQNEHRAHNFYIQGNYGYLSDELEGVQILDISNPRAITRVGRIETTGNAFWVVADFPYVYVAEEENGVVVYDVTNMSSPQVLGKYDTPGWAWELILSENIVYVADKSGGLQIIDFSDKNNPVRVGQFIGPKNARSISLEDNLIFMADGAECVCIIDVSNPKFPALINKMRVDGYIADVFKSGKNLFMANETQHSMEILDVSSLPDLIPGGSYQAEDKIYGLWKEDVYVFVAANSKTLILRYNSPPKLAVIEDRVHNEQEAVTVIAEAFDPDGDVLSFEVENLPEGAVFDSLNGTLIWTPTFEQSGVYSNIIIRVVEFTDSRLTDVKSFTITVNHVNRPPSLPEVEDQRINENETLAIEVAEASDEDKEDIGQLVYSVENLPEGASYDALKRVLSWKPTYEQSGIYSLDFVVSDQAGGIDRDACTITVNHVDRKPVIQAITSITINENELLEFAVEGQDLDKEDQNAISFRVLGLPDGATFSSKDNKVSWTPSYDQSGTYENLTFIMKAGNLSDTTVTSITVRHVNRPPVMYDIAGQTVEENKTLRFDVGGADPDTEDQGKLIYSASNLPEGATFHPDSMFFSWIPSYEQSGTFDNVAFTVNDPSGLNATTALTIKVNHVNRPPVLNQPPVQTVDENSPLTFNLEGNDPDKEDQNSLKYSAKKLPEGADLEETRFSWIPTFEQSGEYTVDFTLSDGQQADTKSVKITINHINRMPAIEPIEPQVVDENKPLQFKVIGTDPDKEDTGKWTLAANQLPEGAVFSIQSAMFTWTPTFEQSGNYSVTFTNTDEQGLTATQDAQITVNHINRIPVFNPLPALTVDENTPVNFVVPAGEDPDIEDAQKLAYTAQNLPEGTTFDQVTLTLDWTPTYDQSGIYEIPILLTDGEFNVTQAISVSVTNINRAPMLADIPDQTVDENQAFNYTVQFNDPDGEDEGKLKLSASNLPEGMTFDATSGVLQWIPTYNQAGTYPGLQLMVQDVAGLIAEKSFSATVTNVNRSPELSPVPNQTVLENAGLSVTFQGTDPDEEDNGKLQYSIENLPTGAVLDPGTGTLNWTPNYTQAGTYGLKLKVTDTGGLTAEVSVLAEVMDVNRLPQIQSVEAKTVNEGAALIFAFLASDEDTDNTLTFNIDNLPGGANLDPDNGEFSWTPDFDQAGDYTLSAKVSDKTAESTTTISITVNNVNRVPVIEGDVSVSVTVGENAELSFSASDPDGDNLTFTASDLPEGARLDPGSGKISWTPSEDQIGNFSFAVTVSDGVDNAEATGRVTVNPKPAIQDQTPADSTKQN